MKHQTEADAKHFCTLHMISVQYHITVLQVETKSEREARGQPVGRDVPYAAMGGLTGFSSLLDGYLALEACGSGTGYVLACLTLSDSLSIAPSSNHV